MLELPNQSKRQSQIRGTRKHQRAAAAFDKINSDFYRNEGNEWLLKRFQFRRLS